MSLPDIEKYYLSLDTQLSDVVNSDFTKHTWYLKNLLGGKKIKNVISVKIYTSAFMYLMSNDVRNRLTIKFDQFVESFKHQDREFQFLGELDTTSINLARLFNKYIHYRFPYGDGEFKFNEPIRVLDELTMSIADPFEPIRIERLTELSSPSISLMLGSIRIDSPDLAKSPPGRFLITGLTSDDPADDAVMDVLNDPNGITGGYSASLFVSANYVGNLSSFRLFRISEHVMVNLEISCVRDKKLIGKNDGVFDGGISRLRVSYNIFNKLNPYRVYLNLDTDLADVLSFNVIGWYTKEFSSLIQGYTSVYGELKNIIAIKMNPILVSFTNSYSTLIKSDVFLIYLRELGTQCFANLKSNVRYNFVLEKRFKGPYSSVFVPFGSPGVQNRNELSVLHTNDGWFRLNKPLTQLRSVTLESFQRVMGGGYTFLEPMSILDKVFGVYTLMFNGVNMVIEIDAADDSIMLGDILVLRNITKVSGDLISQLNSDAGFRIIGLLPGLGLVTSRIILDTTINAGLVNFSGDLDIPYAYVRSNPTNINIEFVCIKGDL